MSKTVYRSTHKKNYTVIGNSLINREGLTWKAKGILIYLLSKPENWITRLEDIVKHGDDGRAAVLSGLKELKDKGYLEKIRVTDPETGRITHWETIVHECPISRSPDVENRHSGNPDSGNPQSGESNPTKYRDIQSTENRKHQPTNNPETAKAGCMVGVTNIFSRAEDDQAGPTPSKKPKPHRKERAAKPHISTGYTPKEWGNATAVAKALVTEWKEELGLRLSKPLVAACVGVGVSQAHDMAIEVFAADWVNNPMGLLITKLKALNQDPIGEHKESLIASVDNVLWQIEESAGLQYEMVSDSEYLYAMPGDEEWTREKRWILPAGYTWSEEESA